MNDKTRIALIAAAALIICVSLWIYFSPYQTCLREVENAYTCAKLLGGNL
jgi:hypothetical protein